jgi:tetratricopeptide (TPR) repeat protein
MIVPQQKLDSLFDELAEKIRSSARQSRGGILQSACRRLATNRLDKDAIHVIAASHLQDQKPTRSLSVLNKAPDILGDNPIGHRVAGYACLVQREMDVARWHFDQSIRLDPCQPDCWTTLGRIHEDLGEHQSAIEHYRRAMVFDDSQHDSALALSKLYVRNHNLTEAIHTLRVSLIRDQRSAKLNLALARLLQRRAAILRRKRRRRAQTRFLEEAVVCYQTANSSDPTAKTFIAQGIVQQKLERFAEARRSFQRAVAFDPRCPAAITHLAGANVENGDIDQALVEFEAAIALDPHRAAAHFRYSRAKRFKAGPETDRYIQQLLQLASDTQLPTIGQVQLHFALAKVLDDIGRYDEAWHHYDRGNRLKPGHSQSQSTGRVAARRQESSQIPLQQVAGNAIRFFTREFLAANQHLGNPSETPVFIVGMPRSGTTLTEQILSSHPSIAGAGELKGIDQIRQELIAESRQPRAAQHAPGPAQVYPSVLASLSAFRIRELADEYLSHLDDFRTDESRVTDKMPTNFMHLGLIALLFPRATIVHCRRNPLDILVSCYCQNLNAPFCDLDQLVHYHRQYCRMMEHWKSVLPIPIHTVDYESLVTDPEPNSRDLIKHCGLPWDERCLRFHANRRAVHTPSKWQVRQPMYSSSIEKWKRFEPHLRHIAEQFD